MWGRTLQEVRENKGMKPKIVAANNFTTKTLSRIEADDQVPSADKFFHHIYRLNLSFDEFCFLSQDDYLNTRIVLKTEVGEVLRQQNVSRIAQLMKKVSSYRESYDDVYFDHLDEVLKAAHTLIVTKSFEEARKELNGVIKYLDIDEWYQYEITLFNNIFHYYEYETAKSLCQKAIRSIQKHFKYFKDIDVTYSILNNFAVKALESNELMEAYDSVNTALGLPQSTNMLYSKTLSMVIHQVISYKLANGQYDEKKLFYLIDYFAIIDMPEVQERLYRFVSSHNIKTPISESQ